MDNILDNCIGMASGFVDYRGWRVDSRFDDDFRKTDFKRDGTVMDHSAVRQRANEKRLIPDAHTLEELFQFSLPDYLSYRCMIDVWGNRFDLLCNRVRRHRNNRRIGR